jgi:hypothetical protein
MVEGQIKMFLENEKIGMGKALSVDRRKHPRYLVEVPLDFAAGRNHAVSTGLTANASEGGLMAFMGEQVDVGSVLNVTLLFRLGFALTSMESRSVVVWRDDVWKEYLDNYRYGLMFLEPESTELEKLRRLFKTSERQETLYVSNARDGS